MMAVASIVVDEVVRDYVRLLLHASGARA